MRLKFSEVKPKMTELFALTNNNNNGNKNGSYLLNYCHIVDNVRCSVYIMSLNPPITLGGKYHYCYSIQLSEANTVVITLSFQMEEWRLEEAE